MFADIAGFTALTEAHGDLEAAQLVDDFCASVRAEMAGGSGTFVKTIGDALMLRIPDPAEAVRLGVRIVEGLMYDQAPSVRVGLHHGPALERDGDYFGATVNVAARVSALAKGGEVFSQGEPPHSPPTWTTSTSNPAVGRSFGTCVSLSSCSRRFEWGRERSTLRSIPSATWWLTPIVRLAG